MNFQNTPALIDERALASRLGVSVACLRAWRQKGAGPQYLKLGAAVRYSPEAVAAWLAARAVTPSAA